MADLEQRVIALETRVEALTAEVALATDRSTTAGRDALTAREAHQRNIELLNALRRTQAEHGRTLAEHSVRFDRIDQRLHGLDGLNDRMQTIEVSLGQLTVGMHTIEGLLSRLVDERR